MEINYFYQLILIYDSYTLLLNAINLFFPLKSKLV